MATVRQVAHRAKEHVRARRKRFQPVDPARTAQITERFLTAAATGDMEGLLAMLAPNVTWTADSGGKVSAARSPVVGADKVAATVMGVVRKGLRLLSDVRIKTVICNGVPAMVTYSGDRLEGIVLIEIVAGKITNLYVVRNPDKLAAIAVPRTISR